MRRFILSVLATTCAVLVLARDAQAQRWRGGYRGYDRYGWSGANYQNYGTYSPGYGYYGGHYQPRVQSYGYYQPNVYNYSTPGYAYGTTPGYAYGTAPNYNHPSATYNLPNQPSNIISAGYMDPNVGGTQVLLRVIVPDPSARIFVQDQETRQGGTERVFYSPPLERGASYTYTVRATWMESGQEVTREKKVDVVPGQQFIVNFGADRAPEMMPRTIAQPPIPGAGTLTAITGEIVRIENEQIIFTEKGGGERSFRLAPGGRIMLNGTQSELSSLKPGMHVSIMPQANSTSIATTIEVRQQPPQ